MTIKELKEVIATVPDNYDVIINIPDIDSEAYPSAPSDVSSVLVDPMNGFFYLNPAVSR